MKYTHDTDGRECAWDKEKLAWVFYQDEAPYRNLCARSHDDDNGELYDVPPVAESTRALSFSQELEKLINKHSMENGSNTPDFILAEYLMRCLETWNLVTNNRDTWYKKK